MKSPNTGFEYKFLSSGKVKDIYKVDDNKLLMVFTDRISSYDIMLADQIPSKGEIMCKLSAFCFSNCEKEGITTHMLGIHDSKSMIVRKLDMIPLELILRNYLYGSYWKRFKSGEAELPKGTSPRLAARFPKPVIEFTTKREAHDRPITEDEILKTGLASKEELKEMVSISLLVDETIRKDAERGGLILADFKLEFGRFDRKVTLADEAETPDVCRFWDAKSYNPGVPQENFDKQVLRDYLSKELGWPEKGPAAGTRLTRPILPATMVNTIKLRYVEVYERLTGDSFE